MSLSTTNVPYIRWFADLGLDDIPLVGGKNASLGELYCALSTVGVHVPPGFAITADAYRVFLHEAHLDTNDLADLRQRGRQVRQAVLAAPWPTALEAAIDFPKMFRAPLCCHGAERFTVSRHENRDLTGSVGTMQQRSVDLRLQVSELRKVLQMRRFLLDLLPQVFERGEIRPVGWQWLNGPARLMGVDKLLHGVARMGTRSLVHHDDVAPRVSQHVEPKGRRAFRMTASLMSCVAKLAREIVDEAQDLVALPFATGGPFGWRALGGPGRAERAPLGTAGFIATQPQRRALPRLASKARPLAAAPLQPLGLMAMSRDQARLLIGKAQSVEQGRQRMRLIQDAKAALDEVLDHRRVPAARGRAPSLWAGVDQGGPLASLGLGQLAGAARGALGC
jgi:hypothetical protein